MSCAIANHAQLVVVTEEGGDAGKRSGDGAFDKGRAGLMTWVAYAREAFDKGAGGDFVLDGRDGVGKGAHRSQPARVEREVEVGGGFGGEEFTGFVGASDLAQHVGDRAQDGNGWVVAGDIDEEIDDLVEAALLLANGEEKRHRMCRAPRVQPRRFRVPERVRSRSSASSECPASDIRPMTAMASCQRWYGQADQFGEGLHFAEQHVGPGEVGLFDTGPTAATI